MGHAAGDQPRRVNGHLHLQTLRDTLERTTAAVGSACQDDTVNAA